MASLVKSGKYGAINTTDTETNGFYFIMFTSEAYTLQDTTTSYGQIVNAVKLVVKEQYLSSMQVDTNRYWNQKPRQHAITVPTRKILHQKPEFNAVTDFHAIPTSVCTRTQAKTLYQESLFF